MMTRVEEGLYDKDIDNQINHCDEGAPHTDDLSMDRHLAEVNQFVQDGLELQETVRASNPEAGARLEKAAAMGDEEWFLAEQPWWGGARLAGDDSGLANRCSATMHEPSLFYLLHNA